MYVYFAGEGFEFVITTQYIIHSHNTYIHTHTHTHTPSGHFFAYGYGKNLTYETCASQKCNAGVAKGEDKCKNGHPVPEHGRMHNFRMTLEIADPDMDLENPTPVEIVVWGDVAFDLFKKDPDCTADKVSEFTTDQETAMCEEFFPQDRLFTGKVKVCRDGRDNSHVTFHLKEVNEYTHE